MFHHMPILVDRVEKLEKSQSKDTKRFSNLRKRCEDVFLSAAQHPPVDGFNTIGWLLGEAWYTKTDNVAYRKYVQQNATAKEAEQKAFNDGIIAQNVARCH